jgi:hypothetical protein
MDLDYNALFGSDDSAAQASASQLAQALRQRRAAGQLGLATGDSANAALGQEMTGNADKMEQGLIGAAQHRAGLDVQRKHLAQQAEQLQAMMGYRTDQLGLRRDQIDAQNALRQAQLDQKAGEQIASHDAFGNPIFVKKFGGAGNAAPRQASAPGPNPGAPMAQTTPPGPIAPPTGGGAMPGGAPAPTGAPGTTPTLSGPPPSKGIPDGRGGYLLNPQALDQAAEMYARTATLPPVAQGRGGALIRAAIANRAAELRPDTNLAGNKASYHADSASQTKLQGMVDNTDAFERTALANLDTFLGTARNVVDRGSPLWNAGARQFATRFAGDPKMAAFNAARQTAVQEIGKVLGGASAGGAISDSARHEVESLLPPDASLAQLEQASAILRKDMLNRRQSYQQQLHEIQGRAGSVSATPKATHRFNPETGKIEAIGG